MNILMAGQVIRDNVKMTDVLDLYGYKPKRGFMCCPFHGEKTPSLKIYDGTKGFCCFGCGKKGSVIDFVMLHENCNFSTAVRAIDNALNLGLLAVRDPQTEEIQYRRQKSLDRLKSAFDAFLDECEESIERRIRFGMKWSDMLMDIPKQERTAKDWDRILLLEEDLKRFEYLKCRINETREEVALWRRKARVQSV